MNCCIIACCVEFLVKFVVLCLLLVLISDFFFYAFLANLGLIKRDKCQSGLNVRSKFFVILADFASYGCNVVVDSGKDTG